MKHFNNIQTAKNEMRDGEVFSFTFGTLAHYDRVMFVAGVPYSVTSKGKTQYRLYVD